MSDRLSDGRRFWVLTLVDTVSRVSWRTVQQADCHHTTIQNISTSVTRSWHQKSVCGSLTASAFHERDQDTLI